MLFQGVWEKRKTYVEEDVLSHLDMYLNIQAAYGMYSVCMCYCSADQKMAFM